VPKKKKLGLDGKKATKSPQKGEGDRRRPRSGNCAAEKPLTLKKRIRVFAPKREKEPSVLGRRLFDSKAVKREGGSSSKKRGLPPEKPSEKP